MKKCLNCNQEFLDDSLFCPECGEQLVSNDTCPTCHGNVKPEDKFCRYCGRKIERIRVCSECGKLVDNETNFCPKCGNKISNDGFITNKPSKGNKKVEKDGTIIPNKTLSYIFVTIFSVLAILFIVGMFGDVMTSSGNIYGLKLSGSQSIRLFFGEGAENLKNIQTSYKYQEYYSFSLFEFVLMNIFYFGGLLGLIASAVFMIMNFVKVFTKNESIKRGPVVGLVISVIPYLFGVSFQNSVYAKASTGYLSVSFGWGTIILVVAVLCTLCALTVYDVFAHKNNSKNIFLPILSGLASIIMTCMVLFGHGFIVAITGSGETDTYNCAYYVRNVLSQFSSDAIDKVPNGFAPGLVGYGLILLSGLFMISSTYLLCLKKSISSLSFFGVAFVMFIVGSALATVAFKEQNSAAIVGGGAIAVYILGVFAIAGMIGYIILKKKEQ
ncbi:MAG: zinc ribbon domain-containing protein [Bacilli bacterium]|nr:zinc ribbon domain-containing protein [Bacilli bacterium]